MLLRFLLLMFVGIAYGMHGSGRKGACAPFTPRPADRLKVRQYLRKSVKFVCEPGYMLLGEAEAVCVRGEWSAPQPLCVRAGCKVPASIPDGVLLTSFKNAVIVVECEPGHDLVGSGILYCDGKKWNGTVPTCVRNKEHHEALSCDFEHGPCGWTAVPVEELEWSLVTANNAHSYRINTGPPSDHTLGQGNNGHYMAVSGTSFENQTSKFWPNITTLRSPLYSSELTKDGCFSFYYYFSPFEYHIGMISVAQIQENSETIDQPELAHRTLQIAVWTRDVLPLTRVDHNFGIIITGHRGVSIDDVAILQGEECTRAIAALLTSTTTTTTTTETPSLSCVNRCPPADYEYYTDLREPNDERLCSCRYNCLDRGVCCPDFLDVCVFRIPMPTTKGDGLTTKYGNRTTTKQESTFEVTATSTHSIPQIIGERIDIGVALPLTILVIVLSIVVACFVFATKTDSGRQLTSQLIQRAGYSVSGRRPLIQTQYESRTSL